MIDVRALKDCELRPGAKEEAIAIAEQQLGAVLPQDYRVFLMESNGFEGFVGPDSYVSMWQVEDLSQMNEAYGVSEFCPGLTLLGTDGSDSGYGFVREQGEVRYVEVPLVGMSLESMSAVSGRLDEFVSKLARRYE